MDGLLIVDKAPGPTSHDVVARARRILRERRIGHTGTLDPMASGVLPLVLGRATRLTRFLSGDKAYDATIRLGVNTDSYDALGEPIGATFTGPWPDARQLEAALGAFRGTFIQQPPSFSAKKVAGHRSYAIARRARSAASAAVAAEEPEAGERCLPSPVRVTAHAVTLIDVQDDRVRLHVECSAGFYIRSLAFDLGATLGTGGHLVELRRTMAAGFGLAEAVSLERLEEDTRSGVASAAIVPMERMLAALPAVSLTSDGVSRVRVGRNLGPGEATDGFAAAVSAVHAVPPTAVRLLDQSGRLVALADAADTPGLLHPSVVLL
jgi:tRNA pseudouridine55 synthase